MVHRLAMSSKPLKEFGSLLLWGVLALGTTACTPAPGPEVPTGVTPAPTGAATLSDLLCISDERFRFGEGVDETAKRAWHLDRFEELGVTKIRHDFRWSTLERVEGVQRYELFDAGVAEVAARGLEMVAILDYGVPWASSQTTGDTAFPPDDPADFAAYAERIATRYGDRVHTFEIWNEQNSGLRFWKPEEDPAAYGDLLHAAAASIRGARPDARVVYGGLFFQPQVITGAIDFLTAHFAAHPDAGDDFDALSFHPYPLYPPSVPPEVADNGEIPVEDMIAELRALLAAHGMDKPLLVTEFGWPDFHPVTPELQAAYLARETLWLAADEIELACWFTLIDGPLTGRFPPEDNFGLFSWDLTTGAPGAAKPAWYAMNTLSQELGELAMVRRTDAELDLGKGAYSFLLASETGHSWAHVVWSFEDSFAGEVTIPQPEGATVRAVDALGAEVPLSPTEGGVRVPYGPMPVYVLGQSKEG